MASWLAVWRWISFRHLFREGGARAALPVAGVALGVAVLLAIRLANASALAAFVETVEVVAGRANLQVAAGPEGFDERLFPLVRAVPGVTAAAPVVQLYVPARPGPPLVEAPTAREDGSAYADTVLLLGTDLLLDRPFARYVPADEGRAGTLDFLADPRAAALPRGLAIRWGAALGDEISIVASGRTEGLRVRQILDGDELEGAFGGNLVVLDISVAQDVLQRWGRLDRIDLIVPPKQVADVRERLAVLLPPGVQVMEPAGRTGQVENLIRSFELNLTALSFIALFVSMFLIFNALSLAVVRRRREIGILRSLGLTRGQVARQFLGEGLVIGVLGTGLGLALGTLLASGALRAVSRTISALYLVVQARTLHLDPAAYLLAGGVGLGVAIAAALFPAREAAATPPALTVRQGAFVETHPVRVLSLAAAGVGLLLVAAAVAWVAVAARWPFAGFLTAGLLLIGFALLVPVSIAGTQGIAASFARRLAGPPGLLGARYLSENLARSSTVAAALMVSVGMLVGLGTMVGSFRRTVDLWIGQTIRGDLYVEPVGRSVGEGAVSLPSEVLGLARDLPGVLALDTYRGTRISHRNRLAFAAGVDLEVQAAHGNLLFLQGDSTSILRRARETGGVVITESFAHHHRVRAGETLRLETPSGPVDLLVHGIYHDYTSDAGGILMDHRLFERLWQERRVESLAIYLAPGADAEEARRQLADAIAGRWALHVTPNQALRRRVLRIFDQTFQITYALQAIALLVAVLGVISTLTALIIQRSREIAVLRAVGATRAQVRRMVLVESGLLGLMGAVLGCLCGVLLSLLLIYVINKQFFGWSIQPYFDVWLFVQAVAVTVPVSLLAGLLPAGQAASRSPAEAMRIE
jgi:putative ABC transport system permease protein